MITHMYECVRTGAIVWITNDHCDYSYACSYKDCGFHMGRRTSGGGSQKQYNGMWHCAGGDIHPTHMPSFGNNIHKDHEPLTRICEENQL